MSNNADKQQQLLDRADVRVKHEAGIGGAINAFIDRVRSGDLGALPVVVGLVVIWTVFATLNPIFLSSTNLVNLLFDSSTVGVIALGVVLMLMVGEIDLSIGSVSGFASALLGVLWVNHGWPVPLAILGALAVGGLIGYIYAQLYNRFGMPSFVATLAGLLAVLVLWEIAGRLRWVGDGALPAPTAALGVAQTAEVLNLIERVRDRGLGVVMISHNMEDVRAVADRIVVLRLGKNNGVFYPDASNAELVGAITGASDNSVSRRAGRKAEANLSGDTQP